MNTKLVTRIFILSLLSLSVTTTVLAQADENLFSPSTLDKINNILPPSPNAGSLGKYGNLSIGLSTGTPDVKIDLPNLNTAKPTLHISADYTTSGFLVNQVASDIGLGWTLDLGGVITRTIYDEPDEMSTHPSIYDSLQYWTEGTYNFLKTYMQNNDNGNDLQPDLFSFNFCGYSGNFVLDSNFNPVSLPYSNLKIESNFFSDGPGDIEQHYTFKITTPNGVAYYFGGDATELRSTDTYGTNASNYKDFGTAPTSWYLRKMIDPNGDSIVFYYSSHESTFLSDIEQSESRSLIDQDQNLYSKNGGSNCMHPNGDMDATMITKTQNQIQRLDSVKFSNGASLRLDYIPRSDLSGGFLLRQLTYYFLEDPAQRRVVQFSYAIQRSTSFANSWNQDDSTLGYRPFLIGISEINNEDSTQNKNYRFFYNNLNSLPRRLSYCVDYWGYFNGANNSTLLYISDTAANNLQTVDNYFVSTANREPDPEYAMDGILSKIVYPTRGYDSLIYEGNTYSGPDQIKTNVQNETVDVNATGNSDGTPYSIQQSFSPNQSQTVSLNAYANFIGDSVDFEPEYYSIVYSIYDNTSGSYLLDADPQSPLYGKPINNLKLYAGNHSVGEADYIVNLTASHSYTIFLTIYGLNVFGRVKTSYQNFQAQTITTNFNTGGVRIRKIISFDSFGYPKATRKFYYTYPSDTTLSSFSYEDAPTSFDNIRLGKLIASCSFSFIGCDFAYQNILSISSNPRVSIRPYNGSSVTYPCVLESFGDNFEDGGIEHRFQLAKNLLPIKILGTQSVLGPPYSFDWLNGLEVYSRKFKKTSLGQLQTVQEDSSFYSIDSSIKNDFEGLIIRKNYDDKGFDCTPLYDMGQNLSLFDAELYQIPQRWLHLDSTLDIIYDDKDHGLMTKKSFIYTNVLHTLPTRILSNSSKGDITYEKFKYPQDYPNYASCSFLENLFSVHAIGLPIEEIQIDKKANGSQYVTGGKISVYKDVSGRLLLDTIFLLNVSSPIPLNSFNESGVNANGIFIHDIRYKPEIIFDSYDSSGNLLQQHKMNDALRSYIWDYNKSYPVAEAVNASQSDIAYTSFEADGKGYWTFSGTPVSTKGGITGTMSYSLASGAVSKSGLTSSTKYIVSYWLYSGGSVSISGGTQSNNITGYTARSWTYHEVTVTGTTSISLSGSGYIDELRLYPADAQMTTYTYEPLIGMTSKCSPDNKILYYEYDGLGRLQDIKDEDGNITKTVDYHYKH